MIIPENVQGEDVVPVPSRSDIERLHPTAIPPSTDPVAPRNQGPSVLPSNRGDSNNNYNYRAQLTQGSSTQENIIPQVVTSQNAAPPSNSPAMPSAPPQLCNQTLAYAYAFPGQPMPIPDCMHYTTNSQPPMGYYDPPYPTPFAYMPMPDYNPQPPPIGFK